METDFSLLIPHIRNLSQKFDNTTLILSNHWVLVDEINSKKILHIFRNNNELIISEGGRVDIASWRYLGKNTLIIEKNKEKSDNYTPSLDEIRNALQSLQKIN